MRSATITLLHGGEEIPIEVEHAPRLAAAVEALRRENAALPADAIVPEDALRCLAKAERALRTALAELEKVSGMSLDMGARLRLQSVVGGASDRLQVMQVKV